MKGEINRCDWIIYRKQKTSSAKGETYTGCCSVPENASRTPANKTTRGYAKQDGVRDISYGIASAKWTRRWTPANFSSSYPTLHKSSR